MKTQLENYRNFAGGITLAAYLADPPPHAGGPSIADAPQPHFEAFATRFRDRTDAGLRLAHALSAYANRDDVLVLALPRGGVPVAAQAAIKLNAPLDILLVRKLGVPFHRELGMGAMATGGVRIINKEIVDALGLSTEDIEIVAREEQRELERREKAYRGDVPAVTLEGKTVILVDDGIATGSTMLAAIAAARQLKAAHIVVAIPTVAASTYLKMREVADDVVALIKPEEFYAVGQWYESFPQTTDQEVRQLLAEATQRRLASCKHEAKPHRKQRGVRPPPKRARKRARGFKAQLLAQSDRVPLNCRTASMTKKLWSPRNRSTNEKSEADLIRRWAQPSLRRANRDRFDRMFDVK
jgi:putative phosphoribosyl transferase